MRGFLVMERSAEDIRLYLKNIADVSWILWVTLVHLWHQFLKPYTRRQELFQNFPRMRKEVWIAPGIVYMCHPNKLITEHRTLNTEDSTLNTQHCYDNKTLHQTRACVDVLSWCRPSHGAHPPLAVDNEVPAIERCSLRYPPVEMDEDIHPSAGGADSETPRRAWERILTRFPPAFSPQMLKSSFNVTQRYITLHNITLPVWNFVIL